MKIWPALLHRAAINNAIGPETTEQPAIPGTDYRCHTPADETASMTYTRRCQKYMRQFFVEFRRRTSQNTGSTDPLPTCTPHAAAATAFEQISPTSAGHDISDEPNQLDQPDLFRTDRVPQCMGSQECKVTSMYSLTFCVRVTLP